MGLASLAKKFWTHSLDQAWARFFIETKPDIYIHGDIHFSAPSSK